MARDSLGEDAASSYAGPMNRDPMGGEEVMDRMGEMELRKKKKNLMDIDYAGPESPSGFEGEAGNTFSKEGLDKMNQHYAQTQQSMAAG